MDYVCKLIEFNLKSWNNKCAPANVEQEGLKVKRKVFGFKGLKFYVNSVSGDCEIARFVFKFF